jgi:hypothetical protein
MTTESGDTSSAPASIKNRRSRVRGMLDASRPYRRSVPRCIISVVFPRRSLSATECRLSCDRPNRSMPSGSSWRSC